MPNGAPLPNRVVPLLVVPLLTLLLHALPSHSADSVAASFDDLKNLGRPPAASSLVKLTYLGPQDEPIPTIGFSSSGYDVKRFEPCHRPGLSYGNDAMALETVPVSDKELDSIVSILENPTESSKLVRPVVKGQVGERPLLSVSVLWRSGEKDRCFEAVFDSAESKEFFVLLRGTMENNAQGRITLQWWGCALDLLTPVPGKDVTTDVRVTLGGLYQGPGNRNFRTRVDLKNISDNSIPEPLTLVVIPRRPNVRLVNYDGTTCKITPVGAGFVNIPLPAPALSPGESLETVLEFENPDRDPIRFDTKVIAGPIER